MYQLLSPAQLIQLLLSGASYSLRHRVLVRALEANQRILQQLADYRLASIERGQEAAWQEKQARTQETLAEIERALATC